MGVSAFGEIALVELAREFAAAAIFRAGKPEDTVAGAVRKKLSFYQILRISICIPCLHGCDTISIHNDILNGSVEQQLDIGFIDDRRIDHVIPKGIALEGIVAEVPKLHFLQDAGLLVLIFQNADNAHPHFARGVSAEDRTVLDKNDLRPVPRRRNGSADPGEASAADNQVGLQFDILNNFGVLLRQHGLLGLGGNGDKGQDPRAECPEKTLHSVSLLISTNITIIQEKPSPSILQSYWNSRLERLTSPNCPRVPTTIEIVLKSWFNEERKTSSYLILHHCPPKEGILNFTCM